MKLTKIVGSAALLLMLGTGAAVYGQQEEQRKPEKPEAKPQPERAQQSKPQPEHAQQAKPQPERAQQAKPQPERAQQAKPQPERAQQAKPQPDRAQQAKPQPQRAQQANRSRHHNTRNQPNISQRRSISKPRSKASHPH